MSNSKDNMSRRIYIRLKERDFEAIQKRFSKTTCRKLSEYARRVLLDKVITVNHRNQSLDDFMTEMIRL
jgi:predicted DNA binding CopG/RHH family protein